MVEQDSINRRKIYQTTPIGRKLLDLELDRMSRLIAASQNYLEKGE